MTQDIVAATTELAEILVIENAALMAMDLVAAGRMLECKQAATATFEAAQRHAMKVRSSVDVKALRVAATRLQKVTEENRRLLERAIGVQNRVLGIMATAARKADPTPRYARSGVYAPRPTSSWALSASA